jgi:polyketide biosynthesis acyl carrier protein
MTKDEIFLLITSHTREVVPQLETHAFAENDSLRDLGANSIDRSEIVMMTLEAMAMDIPLSETLQARNIGELAQLLADRKASLTV